MKEPLHEIFTWFAFATASIAPGIVGAAFGRGPWMVIAAIFSVLAFFGTTPLGIWYYAWNRYIVLESLRHSRRDRNCVRLFCNHRRKARTPKRLTVRRLAT
jgi:hypothetical protein